MELRGRTPSRWVSLCMSCLVAVVSGTGYAFTLFSPVVKEKYGQENLDTLSAVGNVGQYIGVFGGLLYDRFGPRPSLAVGVVTLGGGITLTYLALRGTIHVPFPVVCVFYSVGLQGMIYFDTSGLVTAMGNFPNHHNQVIGILKSFTGLGASIYTLMYLGFVAPDRVGFVLMVGMCAVGIGIVGFFLLSQVKGPPPLYEDISPWRFRCAYMLIIVLAGYSAAWAILISSLELEAGYAQGAFGGLVVIVALIFASLVVRTGPLLVHTTTLAQNERDFLEPDARQKMETDYGERPYKYKAIAPDDTGDSDDTDNIGKQTAPAAAGGDASIKKILTDFRFYLLFVIFFGITGAGLNVINNAAQFIESQMEMAASEAPVKRKIAMVVALISVASCLGRLATGFVIATFPRQCSPPVVWIVISATMGTAYFLSVYADNDTMTVIAFFVCGACFGSTFVLVPSQLKDLYGHKHIGFAMYLEILAVGIASFVCNRGITASLYTQQAAKTHAKDNHDLCLGIDCFKTSFTIIGIMSFCCIPVGIALLVATRNIYQHKYKPLQSPNTSLNYEGF